MTRVNMKPLEGFLQKIQSPNEKQLKNVFFKVIILFMQINVLMINTGMEIQTRI
jgi:hypothetical protein